MALTSTCRENGDIVITSGDRLTIENAAEFLNLLREGFEASRRVTLEFEEGMEIDLTGIQLICSACKTAAAQGKSFTYGGIRPAALDGVIQACGAERHTACKQNNNSNCLWFGGIQ